MSQYSAGCVVVRHVVVNNGNRLALLSFFLLLVTFYQL